MKLTDIKRLFASNDNRAVSPVIGVILMVAITVILAAVIGTFVLGLGSGVQSTPQASWDFDYTDNTVNTADKANTENDTLEITHNGGDKIKGSQLSLSVEDAGDLNNSMSNLDYVGDIFTATECGAGDSEELNGSHFDGYANPGNAGGDLALNESTVRIVFERTDQPETAILSKYEGPDA